MQHTIRKTTQSTQSQMNGNDEKQIENGSHYKMVTSNVWSLHKDFSPEKRLQFRFGREFSNHIALVAEKFDDQLLELEELMTYSPRKNVNAFVLPANVLSIRFRGVNHYVLRPQTITDIFNSLRKQQMTEDEIVQISLRIATAWLKIKRNLGWEESYCYYYAYTLASIAKLRVNNKMNLDYSKEEMLEKIFGVTHVIPLHFKYPLKVYTKVGFSSQRLSAVVQDLPAKADLIRFADDLENGIGKRTITQWFDCFDNTLILPSAEKIKLPKKINTVTCVVHRTESYEKSSLSKKQLFVTEVVELLEQGADVYSMFEKLRMSLVRLEDSKDVIRIMKIMSGMADLDYFDPLLMSGQRTLRQLARDWEVRPAMRREWVSFFNDQGYQIKKYMALKQKIAQQWSLMLFKESFPLYYYNMDSLKAAYFALDVREETMEVSTDLNDLFQDAVSAVPSTSGGWPLQEDQMVLGNTDVAIPKKGIFKKMYDHFTGGFTTFLNKVQGAVDATTEAAHGTKELTQKIGRAFDDFKMTMQDRQMGEVAMSFSASGTFKATYVSMSALVNVMFDKIMNCITGLFGVDYSECQRIPFTRLFMMYLLWNSTESRVVKMFIAFQIATEMGIVDGVFEAISKVVARVKEAFQTEEREDTTKFDDFLRKRDADNVQKEKVVKKKIGKIEVPEKENDDLAWCSKICELLDVGQPVILGAIAIGLISTSVANVTLNPTVVGNKILAIVKNVSLAALGISSIPRMFTHIVAIFKFVVDYVKKLFVRNHKTLIEKRKYVEDFLKSAIYDKAAAPLLFMQDPGYCFQFMRDYQKIKKVREYNLDIKDNFIAGQVRMATANMASLFNIVISAMRMYSSGQEPLHIQLYSKVAGVGKTDLNGRIIPVVRAEMQRMERENGLGREVCHDAAINDVAYLSDQTNFADTYFYQKIALIDDMNIFSTNQEEAVTGKMLMLSGNPCVVNKASLEDKGMLYNIKVLVSNTNNAYPEVDGMMTRNALYRRRLLFEVRVRPECSQEDENGGLTGKVDSKKVERLGLDRSKCEHLKIYWRKAELATGSSHMSEPEPHGDYPDAMDVEQFLCLVKSLYKEHHLREMQRTHCRNPIANRMGAYFQSVLNTLILTQKTGSIADENMASMLEAAEKTLLESTAAELREHEVMKKLESRLDALYCEFVVVSDRRKDATISDKLQKLISLRKTNKNDAMERLTETIHALSAYDIVTSWYDFKDYAEGIAEMQIDLEVDRLLGEDDEEREETNEIYGSTGFTFKVLDDKLFLTYDQSGISHENVRFKNLDLSGLTYTRAREGVIPYFELSSGTTEIEKKMMGAYLDWLQNSIDNPDIPRWVEKDKARNKVTISIKAAIATRDVAKKTMFERLKIAGVWVVEAALNIFGVLIKAILSLLVTILGFVALKALACIIAGEREDTAKYDGAARGLRTLSNRPRQQTAQYSNVTDSYLDDMKSVQKGTYRMFVFAEDRQTILASFTAFGLGGTLFGTVKHGLKNVGRKKMFIGIYDPIREQCPDYKNVCYVTEVDIDKDVVQHQTADFAIVDMRGFRSVIDMTKHFINEEDLKNDAENFSMFHATTIVLRPKNNKAPSLIGELKGSFEYRTTGFCQAEPELDSLQTGHRTMEIQAEDERSQTKLGDSGALVFHDNSKMGSRYLIGLASTRSTRISFSYFSTIVTQEMIMEMKKKMPFASRIETSFFNTDSLPEEHRLHEVFGIKEYLRKSPFRTIDISGTSGFNKSPVHGLFPVESQPAIQNDKDDRAPEGARHFLKVSLNKYSGDQATMLTRQDREEMRLFHDMIYDKYFSHFMHTVRVYNSREAITGIRMKGSTPINYHTSAGLPYSLEQTSKGKSPYIRYDEEHQSIYVQDIVYNHVDYYENCYEAGFAPQNFKSEYRKKELVGENKITDPKTRTVGTGNMIHQIIYNKMFKDLYTKIKNVWDDGLGCPFALGVNMEKHAGLIAKHMKWLDCVYDFDVKAWERSVSLDLLLEVASNRAKKIQKAYKQRNENCPMEVEKITQALTVDFMDTEYIFADVLNHKMTGLLSGHPGTFMENSEIHVLLICKIILFILRKKGRKPALSYVLNNFRVIVAADDVMLSLSPAIRDLIGPEDLREGYAHYGFDITSADKTDNIERKNFWSVQFLKHTFKEERVDECTTVILAQPNPSIIYQLFNWISTESKLQQREQFQVNVENAFRFSYFRGEEFYEQVRAQFNDHPRSHVKWHYSWPEMTNIIGQQLQWEEYINNRLALDSSHAAVDFDQF